MFKTIVRLLVLSLSVAGFARAASGLMLPVEEQVAEALKSPKLTIVHFWAPWCSNCNAELNNPQGWAPFIQANPEVNFIFVTVWNETDGRPVLEKAGIHSPKNLTLLLHPNSSRKDGEKVRAFMGLDMPWLPTTWIFREGKILYNIGYGEMRFPILQQFVTDAGNKWEH
jgi:thiol-disulfide isomerase/thioredoxin